MYKVTLEYKGTPSEGSPSFEKNQSISDYWELLNEVFETITVNQKLIVQCSTVMEKVTSEST